MKRSRDAGRIRPVDFVKQIRGRGDRHDTLPAEGWGSGAGCARGFRGINGRHPAKRGSPPFIPRSSGAFGATARNGAYGVVPVIEDEDHETVCERVR